MIEENDLIKQLKEADTAYYETGTAIMTDSDYDTFRDSVLNRFPQNPYFNSVGAPASEHLEKVELLGHMGSQNKIKTDDEALDWFRKHNTNLIASDKLDGSSVEVVYRSGVIYKVVTRGDGKIGSDITQNALKWKNLPHSIKEGGTVVVRGEAMMLITSWMSHFPEKANPRNAGNGVITRKTEVLVGGKASNEHIHFTAFDISGGSGFTYLVDKFVTLDLLGFAVVQWDWVRNEDELIQVRNEYVEGRSKMDYEVDGIVLAIDDLKKQEQAGFSDGGSRPKGQVAWKYESESATTTVTGMLLTQGHTGAHIPTAQLAPVQVGGIEIRNALLNNFQYINELGLNIGDEVEVSRAGDVIPHIVRVTKKNSIGNYPAPTCCIRCEAKLEESGRLLLCVNDDCEGRSYQRIRNWVKKTGIKFLGDSLLEALTRREETGVNPIVEDIPSLYQFSTLCIEKVEVGNGKLGRSMAQKIVDEIEKTRTLSCEIFMGSLGIKFLGRSMVKHIGLATPQDFLDISVEELATKENMGINKAREMKASIMKRETLIQYLVSFITVIPFKAKEAVAGKMTDISICLTGVRLKPEQKQAFEDLGGIEKSGVAAGLSFLVTKDPDSTSSKATKARSLGIPVISLDEFLSKLG